MKHIRSLPPLAVLTVAVAASAAFGLFAYAVVGIRDIGFLLYVTLIGVPFIAFAHDRVACCPRGPSGWRPIQFALDSVPVFL